MATGSDVRDILDLEEKQADFVTKESLFNNDQKKVSNIDKRI